MHEPIDAVVYLRKLGELNIERLQQQQPIDFFLEEKCCEA